MAKKKTSLRNAMVVGSSVGAVAGAALGAAAVAMADKGVRDKTVKTAKKVGTQASKTFVEASKNLPKAAEYGDRSYGTAGGRATRKSPKKKASAQKTKK